MGNDENQFRLRRGLIVPKQNRLVRIPRAEKIISVRLPVNVKIGKKSQVPRTALHRKRFLETTIQHREEEQFRDNNRELSLDSFTPRISRHTSPRDINHPERAI